MAKIPDTVTLWCGDCLERMKDIPDHSVDMILCDLPYGMTQNKWDSVIPLDLIWKEYDRILKETSAVLLFAQMPFLAELYASNKKEFRYEWIWEKTSPSGFLNAQKMPLKYHENILCFYKKMPCFNPQFAYGLAYSKKTDGKERTGYNKGVVRKGGDYDEKRFPADILKFKNPSWGSDKGLHPTQKPVALCAYLIRTYTNSGDVVLDNCMGSGTTGVACVQEGRRFIGIEKEPEYFAIAEKRIADEAAIGRFDFGEV